MLHNPRSQDLLVTPKVWLQQYMTSPSLGIEKKMPSNKRVGSKAVAKPEIFCERKVTQKYPVSLFESTS